MTRRPGPPRKRADIRPARAPRRVRPNDLAKAIAVIRHAIAVYGLTAGDLQMPTFRFHKAAGWQLPARVAAVRHGRARGCAAARLSHAFPRGRSS
jgi:hypothetical protein